MLKPKNQQKYLEKFKEINARHHYAGTVQGYVPNQVYDVQALIQVGFVSILIVHHANGWDIKAQRGNAQPFSVLRQIKTDKEMLQMVDYLYAASTLEL